MMRAALRRGCLVLITKWYQWLFVGGECAACAHWPKDECFQLSIGAGQGVEHLQKILDDADVRGIEADGRGARDAEKVRCEIAKRVNVVVTIEKFQTQATVRTRRPQFRMVQDVTP